MSEEGYYLYDSGFEDESYIAYQEDGEVRTRVVMPRSSDPRLADLIAHAKHLVQDLEDALTTLDLYAFSAPSRPPTWAPMLDSSLFDPSAPEGHSEAVDRVEPGRTVSRPKSATKPTAKKTAAKKVAAKKAAVGNAPRMTREAVA